MDDRRRDLLEFTQRLTDLFHEHPTLRRREFFQGQPILGSEAKDITWFRPDGQEMTPDDWAFSETRVLGLLLPGDAINEVDDRGNPILDDTFAMLLNAYHETMPFALPDHSPDQRWSAVLDTALSARQASRRAALRTGRRVPAARPVAGLAVGARSFLPPQAPRPPRQDPLPPPPRLLANGPRQREVKRSRLPTRRQIAGAKPGAGGRERSQDPALRQTPRRQVGRRLFRMVKLRQPPKPL